MNFYNKNYSEKIGKIAGILFSLSLFTFILFLIGKYSIKLDYANTYIVIIALIIVIFLQFIGIVIKKLLN